MCLGRDPPHPHPPKFFFPLNSTLNTLLITSHTLVRLFLPDLFLTFNSEDKQITFSLLHLPPERPRLLQLYHFCCRLSGRTDLHLAGGARNQEQDLPGGLPDVCQEEQNRDQSRGSASERQHRKPGESREGHDLLRRKEGVQDERKTSLQGGAKDFLFGLFILEGI